MLGINEYRLNHAERSMSMERDSLFGQYARMLGTDDFIAALRIALKALHGIDETMWADWRECVDLAREALERIEGGDA